MELHTFIGWTGSTALTVLDQLQIAPNCDPFDQDSEGFSLVRFVNSQNGSDYIQDEIQQFNSKWNTGFQFYINNSVFVLKWHWFDNLILGEPDQDAMVVRSIELSDVKALNKKFNSLLRKTGLQAVPPSLQVLMDLSIWYNMIQDSSDSSDEESAAEGSTSKADSSALETDDLDIRAKSLTE